MEQVDIYQAVLKRRESLVRVRQEIERELAEVEAFLKVYTRLAATASRSEPGDAQQLGAVIVSSVGPAVVAVANGESTKSAVLEDSRAIRSRPSIVINEAIRALREAGGEPLTVMMLVEVMMARGVRLGDDEIAQKRRVTAVLSASDQFEAVRGVGWKLKLSPQQVEESLDHFNGNGADDPHEDARDFM